MRNAFITPPPTPTQVVSRKTARRRALRHQSAAHRQPGIECRSGGASNDYQVVFTFPSSVTFNSAAVTAGAGSVSSRAAAGRLQSTVNLTGVTNAQTITVTLLGVNDGTSTGDVSVPMGVLVGDTNGDRLRQRGRHHCKRATAPVRPPTRRTSAPT